MKNRLGSSLLGAAAALSAVLLLPAPASAARHRIYVRIAPPPLVVETRPVAPSPKHVWVEGYHRWDGRAYVWVPGRWELAPRPHTAWVPGHWRHGRRGWYWVDGHWRR